MELNDQYFFNREISWLHFNERVLQEAIDPATPLLEQVKFLGIYSNNRDEFFRVRVATLKRMIKLEQNETVPDLKYKVILDEVLEIVGGQEKLFIKAYNKVVRELARNDIYIINEKQVTPEQGEFITQFYKEKVRPNLFPLMLGNVRSSLSLQDASIYLTVILKKSAEPTVEDYALIQVPSDINGRFLVLPMDGRKSFIILLDDVIRYCLKDIFSAFGYDRFESYTIKFTRDAELEIDNDVSKSFLELISVSVKKRKLGEAVRFVYDNTMPDDLLKILIKKLNIAKKDTIRGGGRYHNFKDFMDFPRIGDEKLRYPPAPPVPHRDLVNQPSMFKAIRRKDIMLFFPYQSFQYIIDLLREASIDPDVRSIKMTFYRTTRNSAAMNALINAARNGKYVTVFMEIQARFDEEANIYWTRRLQDEGIKVIQTIPGYKVHAKLILIRRRENGQNRLYANVSTGNYNETTAKVFSDFSLLTCDPRICDDVYNIFELLESKFILPTFKNLIVSPFNIRGFFIDMLDREIQNAKKGLEAWAIIKLNSLVDRRAAAKLYEAARAGVQINLINRGICVIKPGMPGVSLNINAFSIVDKYLEHSRVYIFCNGGYPEYFISSADWMPRNFDHRIEVVCPIYDTGIQQELMDVLKIQMQDNTKSRYLGPEQLNRYRTTDDPVKHRAQFEIYDYYHKKVKIKPHGQPGKSKSNCKEG
ncbi:MAG TPA: polyphosphate kinase 1 [Bacteroidales bacterium]|jgi:polyphosphate kinase|nr:polyphosphate kinase 1 [Bacteroidales bacterium]HNQ83965.1 polyphosphate kinase 1 [Bacteroidales bacterium]HOX79400.1 polyphosphate kinase 1 [Bacteroidales bacterium]HPI87047.1 polyphosphate kinase 1 [Bacteroidales bacterium]HPM93506.1 polyphosphate kinase 1 [Bacteroidales bacterium]